MMKKSLITFFALTLWFSGIAVSATDLPSYIKRVDIVHMTHTDVGYTDHPAVTRLQQMRYLDIAIDAVLQTINKPEHEKFVWQAEGTLAVDDWWQQASPERRADLIKAIQSGQLDIAVTSMNQTATLNAPQWKRMLRWLPEELDQIVPRRIAIQNDVNGFPRAGAMAMLDRNVDILWMGINWINGGVPFDVPAPFWWRMPDGRKVFVWLGEQYPMGYDYFHDYDWWGWTVTESTNLHFRPPRPEEIFKTDEASLRKSHEVLCARLLRHESHGYKYSVIPVSFTNVWRLDNDPPFPALAKFVAAWNDLGLEPAIFLSTMADTLERLKKEADDAPEYSGEFTDWWANGVMSGPREVAASRTAKRNLAAALSPVWGDTSDPNVLKAADKILRELCLFDEHTWGSSDAIGLPHAIDTHAQFNEKARTAYYALAMSKILLSQRARTKIHPLQGNGYYIANTALKPWEGWVYVKSSAFREPVDYLGDSKTITKVERISGNTTFVSPAGADESTADDKSGEWARFWVAVPPAGMLGLSAVTPDKEPVQATDSNPAGVLCDEYGWPKSIHWKGFSSPLLAESPGDFVSVEWTKPNGRSEYHGILYSNDPELRADSLKETQAEPAGETKVERTAHSTIYTQSMKHPRLKWLTRHLEVFDKGEAATHARATLTVRFYRISSEEPEWFYLGSSFPSGNTLPTTSAGGMPFTPFTDQLPGTCMDYFTVDSWVNYSKPGGTEGSWTWISRDAPLVSIGGPQTLKHLKAAPENVNKIYAMVFDNTWMTNFVCDEHGVFEFKFELVQGLPSNPKEQAEYAETFLSMPQLIIHPNIPEEPIYLERLYKP